MSINTLLHQKDGPFTRELELSPAGMGLGLLPQRHRPDTTTDMVCGFCSTGCSLRVHLKDNTPVGLTPSQDYPVNKGSACPKGWEALTVLNAADRATTPLLRGPQGKLEPVSWNIAVQTFVTRIKQVQQQHGDESVAFLSTGQIPTEEMFFLGALAKFGMGIVHGDGNTRQCMASAVVAYKESFGFDAPPYTYADLESSDVLVFVGANPAIAHPILWERVLRNPHDPEIVVIDPRRTESAMRATCHLPLRPKSDLVLLYGLARLLIENKWLDERYIEDHTSGFDEFRWHVDAFTLEYVAQQTGLDPHLLHHTAELIHKGRRVSFWWTMGVNQSYEGVRVAQAIINLALMTGNMGRPGTGANSITGQCNAMGSRLFSNTTNLLGGHDFANEAHRAKIAGLLNINADRIPTRAGWAYNEIINGIATDKIKGLWVIATNPAHSWINQQNLHHVFEKLDFLVVQDMYHTTETAQRAHLVLPAAAWGEKEGTFINSERRIGPLKKVAKPPGDAIPDFEIFRRIADAWGCGNMCRDWRTPHDVFQLMKRISRGQPCDISGIDDYDMLDRCGGVQWPYPETGTSTETERRLFEDGRFYHVDQRARFIYAEPTPMPEPPDDIYPLLLLTGRGSAAQWHTQTRTGKSAILRKLYPNRLHAEINPDDARQYGITNGKDLFVESRRGRVRARAFVTYSIRPGQIFLPMHEAATNQLTDAVFDPYSKQPSYKACAVRVRAPAYWETEA